MHDEVANSISDSGGDWTTSSASGGPAVATSSSSSDSLPAVPPGDGDGRFGSRSGSGLAARRQQSARSRPTLSVNTSGLSTGLYFPGCGAVTPKPLGLMSPLTASGSGLAAARAGNSTPIQKAGLGHGVVESSPSIMLSKTGFVEDVVTPYLPRTAEDAWFNHNSNNTPPGSGGTCDNSSGSTPGSMASGDRPKNEQYSSQTGGSSSTKSAVKRRVIFSDEPIGPLDDGIGGANGIVPVRPPLETVFVLENIDDDELRRSSNSVSGNESASSSSTSAADAAAAAVAAVAEEEAAAAAAAAVCVAEDSSAARATGTDGVAADIGRGGSEKESSTYEEYSKPAHSGIDERALKHSASSLPQEASCGP